MKKFLIILLTALLLTSCTKPYVPTESSGQVIATAVYKEFTTDSFCYLKVLASNFSEVVYVDLHTGCLYIKKGYGMSPIMKPDGTCLTYEEWKENRK